jgi:hypothetical protein
MVWRDGRGKEDPMKRLRRLSLGPLAAVVITACLGSTAVTPTGVPDPSQTPAPDQTGAPQPTQAQTEVAEPTEIPLAEHRIQVRVVDGIGEFYDTVTGEKFVPRGMNYNRFVTSVDGVVNDNVLSTTRYDPATVEADFAAMAALGFNVVRVMMETCGTYRTGCVQAADGRLNAGYFDNLADFLTRAKAHGLYVMVASNTLPDDGYWINATATLQDEIFQSANNEFLNPAAVPIYVDYWESVVRAIIAAGAPLDVIWAYELRQEHHFHWDFAPLNLDEGRVTTANGETYDMSDPEGKMRMIDEGLVYWADTLREAIRAIDPTAPVTIGFFTPNAPNVVMGGDTRLVRTAYFLRNSTMDFFDLHHYAGNGVDDAEIWENFGIAGVAEKPLVLGEHGAYYNWYAAEERAAAAVLGLEVGSCRAGFDGWLVWAWRGDESRDIWWAGEGNGWIAQVVAPVERPDPCEYAAFDFIRFNAALGATVTASSAVDGAPPEHAVDGTPELWNASALPPQWIELAPAAPADVDSIILTVAQDPPGFSRHELWVRQSGGALTLVQVFEGETAEGDVLTWEPGEPLPGVDLVRVVTTDLAGNLWPAWHEIEVLTILPPE